jgi:hypothetical protein
MGSECQKAGDGGDGAEGIILILSRREIAEITERERIPAQRRVLDALGIQYQTRPDGSIVVFREALRPHATTQDRSPPPRLRLSAAR